MPDPALSAQLEEAVADALESDQSWRWPIPDIEAVARLALHAIVERLDGLGETLGPE